MKLGGVLEDIKDSNYGDKDWQIVNCAFKTIGVSASIISLL